jgi:hypothetical protein
MPRYGKHGKPRSRLSTLPTPRGNPCGDSHITTATTATIMYLKTGEARNQSHSHLKELVNHVPGLKRKGCPGTLERGHG